MARRSANFGRTVEAGALKWGTGINPVHSIDTGDQGRQSVAVYQTAGGLHEPRVGFEPVTRDITDSYWYLDSASEDSPWSGIPSEFDTEADTQIPNAGIYGYTDDSGASDRPDLGVETQEFRGSTTLFRGRGWPSWGRYTNGLPGGARIRDRNHGALVSKNAKENPNEDVAQGWLNKEHGSVLNAGVSDPQQLIMQTSMMQRDQTRAGSQRGEGSQSTQRPESPIGTRLVGMKEKHFSGEQRHYDMQPKSQDEIIRPWWSRSAGTAQAEYMDPNAMREVVPLNRNPPEDPYQGPDLPPSNLYGTYGYVGEDDIPYV